MNQEVKPYINIDEFLPGSQSNEKMDQFCNMMKFFMNQNPDMMNSMMTSVMNNSSMSNDSKLNHPEPTIQSKSKQHSQWEEENRIYEKQPIPSINNNQENNILSGYLPTDRTEREVKPDIKR